MSKEGQERYAKVVYWSCLVCLLIFSTTEPVLASEVNESFDVQVILKQVAGLVSTLKDGPDKYVLSGELGVVQAKAGHIGDASRSLVGIPDGFQNDYQKNRLKKEIALAQAKAGRTQSALKIAKTITSLEREYTLGGIALAKAEFGDVSGGLVILREIREGTRAKEEALQSIGELQAKRGDLHGGIQTALQAGEGYPQTLWGIVSQQVNAGHLKKMLTEIRRIPAHISRQLGLMNVVVALLAKKNMDGAIEVVKEIPDGFASAIAWEGIALAQIESGDQTASLISLQRAIVGALATQNKIAKSDFLWRIAGAQAKSGDIVGALQTADTIEMESHQHSALRDIVAEQSKAGDVKGAFLTASRIREKYSFPYPYIFVLQDLARAGKINQAIKIATSLESDLEEDSPFEAIAFGQAESGDIEGALQTLDAIKWKGEMAPYNRAMAFEKISYIQVQNGHLEEAVRTVSRIDESWRSRALRDVSLAFVKEGKVDRALEIVFSIKGEQALADLLQKIAHAQAFQGDTQGVMKWTQKIASPFVKSNVLLGAARGILDAINRSI